MHAVRLALAGLIVAGIAAASGLAACGESSAASGAPPLRDGDALGVAVVLPLGAGPGLVAAGQDLLDAFAGIAGVPSAPAPVPGGEAGARAAVVVTLEPAPGDAALGDQGYRLRSDREGDRPRVTVTANTEVGAMYGLYALAADAGARYLHPEQTFLPDDPDATLPWGYDGAADVPSFALRGFHEHTQHPIVMSDYLLRPGEPGFREGVSRYLRWLARNRQNVLFFHMLKTVDLEAWVPWMQDITREAGELGVGVGAVLGFADQQQNAFKLVRDDAVDPGTGAPVPEDAQIRAGLDAVLAAGLRYVGLQIGTSEFTKPSDALTLARMEAAVAHVRDAWPDVRAFAWIHITCGLDADDGTPFYHLPLQADPALGAFVHTTMFYTLEDPAPVYDCEDFSHQEDFLAAASGVRPQVFFPETAWWLGFDNNVPVALPLTGWSREKDIREVLPRYEVEGHVTFTTGREWTYWQYDHFLTRITWDARVTWAGYLDWLAPVYGEQGPALAETLRGWTALQRKHFYEQDPLLYFYVAGELPQDEIGAAAGILARRPKIPLSTVLAFDDDALAAWEAGDLARLKAMHAEHAALLAAAPAPDPAARADVAALQQELHDVLALYVWRLEHAITLYEGVVEARRWRVEREAEAPDEAVRAAAREAADAKLAAARALTAQALAVIQAGEARYRYPVSLLARPKPASPTAYPYGYLEETSRAWFWSRRDDQLALLVDRVFDTATEAWTVEPDAVFATAADETVLLEPQDPVAASVLVGFIPRLLLGVQGYDGASMTAAVAEDANGTGLPDPGTETDVPGVVAGGTFTGTVGVQPLTVRDTTGTVLGTLNLLDPVWTLDLETEGSAVTGVAGGSLVGEVAASNLVGIILSVPGIDQEGVENLLKAIYDVPPGDPLPDRLAFGFALGFEPGSAP